MTGALAAHGYPGLAPLARNAARTGTAQRTRSLQLALAALLTGLGAAMTGIIAFSRARRRGPAPTEPPADASNPSAPG